MKFKVGDKVHLVAGVPNSYMKCRSSNVLTYYPSCHKCDPPHEFTIKHITRGSRILLSECPVRGISIHCDDLIPVRRWVEI
jgi:hypothetical protein